MAGLLLGLDFNDLLVKNFVYNRENLIDEQFQGFLVEGEGLQKYFIHIQQHVILYQVVQLLSVEYFLYHLQW